MNSSVSTLVSDSRCWQCLNASARQLGVITMLLDYLENLSGVPITADSTFITVDRTDITIDQTVTV